jgi:hypothetical protein
VTEAEYDANTVTEEVLLIVGDLSDPSDPKGAISWVVRPLRDDDPFEHYPEYLDGEIPRYWWVTVGGRGMVADLTMPSHARVYFMGDMAQEEVTEELREARPWCPVHRKNMLNLRLNDDAVYWQCPDDEGVRCDVGGYWAWRAESGGKGAGAS